MSKPTYETVAGTEPSDTEVHEPRTIKRTNTDNTVYMMTEIDDGTFVQWSTCSLCSKQVATCTCKTGPKAPDYIERWRTRRYLDSFKARGIAARKLQAKPPVPVDDQPDIDDEPQVHWGSGDAEYDEAAQQEREAARHAKVTDKTAEKVDDGMNDALEAVRAAKEDQDAGF